MPPRLADTLVGMCQLLRLKPADGLTRKAKQPGAGESARDFPSSSLTVLKIQMVQRIHQTPTKTRLSRSERKLFSTVVPAGRPNELSSRGEQSHYVVGKRRPSAAIGQRHLSQKAATCLCHAHPPTPKVNPKEMRVVIIPAT